MKINPGRLALFHRSPVFPDAKSPPLKSYLGSFPIDTVQAGTGNSKVGGQAKATRID